MHSNFNIDIYGQAPDKMTYTEQANKRSHCQRLTWYLCFSDLIFKEFCLKLFRIFSFIRLSDYLIVGTLHVLAVNSVQSLFNYYTEQLENTPTLAEIQATNKLPEKRDDDEEEEEEDHAKKELTSVSQRNFMLDDDKEEEKTIPPLYITEFVLDLDSLAFLPDLDNFRDIIGEIMQHFKETLLKVENLVPDKYFDAFTR